MGLQNYDQCISVEIHWIDECETMPSIYAVEIQLKFIEIHWNSEIIDLENLFTKHKIEKRRQFGEWVEVEGVLFLLVSTIIIWYVECERPIRRQSDYVNGSKLRAMRRNVTKHCPDTYLTQVLLKLDQDQALSLYYYLCRKNWKHSI